MSCLVYFYSFNSASKLKAFLVSACTTFSNTSSFSLSGSFSLLDFVICCTAFSRAPIFFLYFLRIFLCFWFKMFVSTIIFKPTLFHVIFPAPIWVPFVAGFWCLAILIFTFFVAVFFSAFTFVPTEAK